MQKKISFPVVMKSIALVTSAITALLAALYYVYPYGWILSCAISFGTTAYHFVMRLLVGHTVLWLTHYAFDYRNRWFSPRKWEAVFYRFLRVKYWKYCIPTYDPSAFSLKQHTLQQVIRNMCGAEIVHEVIIVLSFVPISFSFLFGEFPVFLITSILAALYDSIFVIVQRYNRPRLIRILNKQEAHR